MADGQREVVGAVVWWGPAEPRCQLETPRQVLALYAWYGHSIVI